MKKTVAIATLGCKTNQFESAAMAEQLESSGYRVIPFAERADIYIVNSCTVTARTDAETRKLIRRARRLNPQARIVATGCYAQVSPGELEKLPELDCVLGNGEKREIAALLETGENRVGEVTATPSAATQPLTSFAEHTRAFLQIQNGCDSFCSYCIVPYARGTSRSSAPGEVLEGVRRMADSGFKEVVLTGIHLGAYGLDLEPQHSLTDLVAEIDRQQLIPRLRLGSIEPNEIDSELIDLMHDSALICPHLHLPLQSGSDNILAAMGRRYSRSFFRDLVLKIKEHLPHAFIGADVIAGFPGESDDDFRQTLDLIEELPLSDLHVFPFSSRPGTRAATLPGHLPAHTVTSRAEILRSLARSRHARFLSEQVGRPLMVLGQTYDTAKGIVRGLSRNYVQVEYRGNAGLVNHEESIAIAAVTGNAATGRLLPDTPAD